MSNKFIVCGVDSGSANCGISIIDSSFNLLNAKELNLVDNNLTDYYTTFYNYCQEYEVNYCSIEKPFPTIYTLGRLFKTIECIGILELVCNQLNIPVTLYTPSNLKKRFCGKGRADKHLIKKEVEKRYNYFSASTHINDAIMIAHCLLEDILFV